MTERLTHVWPVDPDHPDPALIEKAAAILRSGGLVAFPTETVYGLGANALDPAAVAGIYQAKGRPARNPVIVHVARVGDALPLVKTWTATAQLLAERFWPGPLTLVLPRSEQVPDIVTAGGPTVAIRFPIHPVAQALIRAAGVPIAAPSANRSSELSPTLAEHVLSGLNERIDAILDGGATQKGIESTVVDLSGAMLRLLRPGPIPAAKIEALVGPLDRPQSVLSEEPLPAPGMLAQHYAPRTSLECLNLNLLALRCVELALEEKKIAFLAMSIESGEDQSRIRAQMPWDPSRYAVELYRVLHELDKGGLERIMQVEMPSEPLKYAAELYGVLHKLDKLGLDRILVQIPPETDEWLAVRDRLLRAATPK